ncbi:LD-carboxypeptidase [Clostridium niameyense]|uniref:LD-carboxypeptidase n=1 Tax=Clostridium niameyense TaxID=1622073 RepID=A0A6M0RB22_9CLOT|nr:LD-carboxypeptidase [Clostridium niameyense]NEZ47491.1 LD-carboxypeptidase [Clostridium niameyense]
MSIKPTRLQMGDTIGIVTLGSPLNSISINRGVGILENMGFNVVLGKYVYNNEGYLSTSEERRAEDLMTMFENPNVKAIIPTRGGVGVAGILPYLDYNIIRQNPKIITGYSDITILLNVLYKIVDLITFHSLLLIDFKEDTPIYNYNGFFSATTSTTAPRDLNNPDGIPLYGNNLGIISAPVVGGNLSSFIDNLGTPYEIDTKGKILFLEEVHEPINKVYRYINHLKLAGKFEDCVGIIMGECTGCNEAYGKTYENLLDEVILRFNKPTITNLASGHGYYKATIPIGAEIRMNTFNSTLTILEPTVSL